MKRVRLLHTGFLQMVGCKQAKKDINFNKNKCHTPNFKRYCVRKIFVRKQFSIYKTSLQLLKRKPYSVYNINLLFQNKKKPFPQIYSFIFCAVDLPEYT